MRYGVFADVHGNLPALEAVLAAFASADVDAYLCAGDLVGYGPFPNECAERVAALRAQCVAGNHDLIALGRLDAADCIPLAQQSLAWTEAILTPSAREYLQGLPLTVVDGAVVVAHGSLTDPREYTRRPAEAARQLELLRAKPYGGDVLILGHTHRPWAYGAGLDEAPLAAGGRVAFAANAPVLVNPGGVGQSREREPRPRARCVVLDLERREAEFLALEYDVDASRAALRSVGLSEEGIHLRPHGPLRRALWSAKQAVRATGRG